MEVWNTVPKDSSHNSGWFRLFVGSCQPKWLKLVRSGWKFPFAVYIFLNSYILVCPLWMDFFSSYLWEDQSFILLCLFVYWVVLMLYIFCLTFQYLSVSFNVFSMLGALSFFFIIQSRLLEMEYWNWLQCRNIPLQGQTGMRIKLELTAMIKIPTKYQIQSLAIAL